MTKCVSHGEKFFPNHSIQLLNQFPRSDWQLALLCLVMLVLKGIRSDVFKERKRIENAGFYSSVRNEKFNNTNQFFSCLKYSSMSSLNAQTNDLLRECRRVQRECRGIQGEYSNTAITPCSLISNGGNSNCDVSLSTM